MLHDQVCGRVASVIVDAFHAVVFFERMHSKHIAGHS